MRFLGTFILVLSCFIAIAQDGAKKEEKLSPPPELYVDDEMPLLDDYGFFSDKKGIMVSPSLSFDKDKNLFQGASIQFINGGVTDKIAYNFSIKYLRDYVFFAPILADSIYDINMSELGLTAAEKQLFQQANFGEYVDDSSRILDGQYNNIRFEFNPRLYFLENVGMYLGLYLGGIYNMDLQTLKPTASFTSGFSFVLADHILADTYIGVTFDDSMYGRANDLPIKLKVGLSLGFVWYSKKSEYNFYE